MSKKAPTPPKISEENKKKWISGENREKWSESYLKTLLDFAYCSLEKLAPVYHETLSHTLHHIPFFYTPGTPSFTTNVGPTLDLMLRRLQQGKDLTQRDLRAVQKELSALQQELRDVLDRVMPRDPDAPGEDWIVQAKVREIRVRAKTLRREFLIEWPGSFWISCAELLSECRGRLARCANAECRKVFLKLRSDSRFCSAPSEPCSRQVRNREYYDANLRKEK